MKNKYYFRARISERQFRHLLRLYCADVCALTAAESQPFTGEVEVDESYFGPSRVRRKRGRGAAGKIPVIGLLKRGGHVYVKVLPDCSREALRPIIHGQVLAPSTIYTDGWRSYDGLVLDGFRHHRIHHHANQFARAKIM